MGYPPALKVPVQFAPKFQDLFRPKRYKIYWGGRGSGKSFSFSAALVMMAAKRKEKILCAREYQVSIRDSVHSLLTYQIDRLGLKPWYKITDNSITCPSTGSEFIFTGLHRNADEVKSMHGITKCWIEEAHSTEHDSWEVLIPTIREPGSEIWISFNQKDEEADTYQRFVAKPPDEAFVHCVLWEDNPWFTRELDLERRYMLSNDPDAYQYVWGRSCRTIGSNIIFKGKYKVHAFDPPLRTQFLHGMDFGFANDPSVLLRGWITQETDGEHLWIDKEAFGHHIELDHLPAMMDQIETARNWPIWADCSRPETISYLRRQGFNIDGAEKWSGCVEDGIEHIKGFRVVHIHERCKHMAEEAALYSYKKDKNTGAVLPIVVDAHNHCWDGVRYSLNGIIKHRGGLKLWERLAG